MKRTIRVFSLLLAAVMLLSAQALAIPIPDSMKDAQRARIFKAMLTSIARQNRTMP